jgi:hypothetical protein
MHNYKTLSQGFEQTFYLGKNSFFFHPEFDPVTWDQDIALIKLPSTATFSGKQIRLRNTWPSICNGLLTKQNSFAQSVYRIGMNPITSVSRPPLLDGVQLMMVC